METGSLLRVGMILKSKYLYRFYICIKYKECNKDSCLLAIGNSDGKSDEKVSAWVVFFQSGWGWKRKKYICYMHIYLVEWESIMHSKGNRTCAARANGTTPGKSMACMTGGVCSTEEDSWVKRGWHKVGG